MLPADGYDRNLSPSVALCGDGSVAEFHRTIKLQDVGSMGYHNIQAYSDVARFRVGALAPGSPPTISFPGGTAGAAFSAPGVSEPGAVSMDMIDPY